MTSISLAFEPIVLSSSGLPILLENEVQLKSESQVSILQNSNNNNNNIMIDNFKQVKRLDRNLITNIHDDDITDDKPSLWNALFHAAENFQQE